MRCWFTITDNVYIWGFYLPSLLSLASFSWIELNHPWTCWQKTGVQISDVHYRMAFGTSSTKVAINLNCSDNVPCTNLNLDTVELDSAIGGEKLISSCNNAFGTAEGIVKPKSCLRWFQTKKAACGWKPSDRSSISEICTNQSEKNVKLLSLDL